jgi:hypothetical protein
MNAALLEPIAQHRAPSLAPLQVLPVQFLPDARRRAAGAPEQQLMAAVLEDAIHVYQKLRRREGRVGRKMRRELQHWFASDDEGWLFSFRNCCEVLNLDADRVREQVAGQVGVGSQNAAVAEPAR